jgi:hypothetical protein
MVFFIATRWEREGGGREGEGGGSEGGRKRVYKLRGTNYIFFIHMV